jgi:hypothetical protein
MNLLEARDILLEGTPGDREGAVRVLLRAGWSATRVLAEVPSAADLLPFETLRGAKCEIPAAVVRRRPARTAN